MTRFFIASLVLLLSGLSSHSYGAEATVDIINTKGENIGSAFLRDVGYQGVLITISANNLTQGWHGLHIHEVGKCDPSDNFQSSGGHLAGGKSHGFLVAGGPHVGDLPNQMVQSDGTLVAEIFTDRMSLEEGKLVMDGDGSALIIHSGRDDYTSQPSGAAGDRIACGIIKQKTE